MVDRAAVEILLQMQRYAQEGRRVYLKMLQTIMPDFDLVMDGTSSVDETADAIAATVRELVKEYEQRR